MKMKEFGPPGGGRASLAPPLRSANDHVLLTRDEKDHQEIIALSVAIVHL